MTLKKCFLVSPISTEGSETRKRSDELLKYLIMPVCTKLGYEIERADLVFKNDKIDSTIMSFIENSDLVIADLSEHNPNVFYELGYRYALKKPVIQVALKDTKLPFDIATIRTYFYDTNSLSEADNFKNTLEKVIQNLENEVNSILSIEEEEPNKINEEIIKNIFSLKNVIDNMQSLIIEGKNEVLTSISQIKNSTTNYIGDTMEDKMTAIVLKEMIDNPSKADNIMKLANKFAQPDKSSDK